MKLNRIISGALALVMAVGMLTFIPVETSAAVYTNADFNKVNPDTGAPYLDYTGSGTNAAVYATREAKLTDMAYIKTVGKYAIFYEGYTGEVAFVDTTNCKEEITKDTVIAEALTPEANVLFTNPYDISDKYATMSASTKEQLISQITLTYLDNEKLVTMHSFVEAAERDQIIMKDIKNGIRVEYAMGEDAVQRLVPRWISDERFQRFIIEPWQKAVQAAIDEGKAEGKIDEDWTLEQELKRPKTQVGFNYNKYIIEGDYFPLKDVNDPKLTERQVKDMIRAFPISEQMPVRICETNIGANVLKELERCIKAYCPQYTYEELEYDNQETGYVNKDQVPPRFSIALEYKITDEGVDVTLPANGISFDETLYQLQDITILPYMGAGSNEYNGYTFLPDGSGTIFRYEDLKGISESRSGQMYGADYAYHTIKGQNEQTMRLPVFGLVTDYSTPPSEATLEEKRYADSGFLAIITEGDSMATLTSNHGGALHPYNSVYATFTPRPSDTYSLSDGSDGLAAAEWTVTSSRRYTGRYTIKYVMLSGKDAQGNGYDTSYYGMAEAYRDYLTEVGTLKKNDESNASVPLYIESFGSTTGTKRVLSFPVTVDVPLTTFENVQTMASELKEEGIENLNFKLTGFANGGLNSTIPYKLKWQSSLGGGDGFETLVEYAKENGIGLFPEFDFAYIGARENFDGVNLKTQAVRTIDNRYAQKQVYDSGYQEFTNTGLVAVSSSVFETYWNKFSSSFNDYGTGAISMSTIGSDLNSDFDEDEPFHREDSKGFTSEFLAKVDETNKIMLSGGNAYTLGYADVITDATLTSSKYIKSSESIPFLGMVLHGSIVFTGTPLNMEGDMREAVLNCIENGASPFFTLSYQNTQELKNDKDWSRYYSIAYENWKDDVVKYYDIINGALADVQDAYIIGHDFMDATRIPDADEKAEDDALEAEIAEKNRKATEEAEMRYQLAVKRAERLGTEMPKKNSVEFRPNLITIDTQSKYKTETGSVVLVEYEGGVQFILNYNSYDINVELDGTTHTVEAMGFKKLG